MFNFLKGDGRQGAERVAGSRHDGGRGRRWQRDGWRIHGRGRLQLLYLHLSVLYFLLHRLTLFRFWYYYVCRLVKVTTFMYCIHNFFDMSVSCSQNIFWFSINNGI